MKKRIISIALALILLVGTAGFASADISRLPKDVWKYFNPYAAALESGDTEKIISTGEAYIAYLRTLPLGEDSGDQLFRAYNRIYANKYYDKAGKPEKQREMTKAYRELCLTLTDRGILDKLDDIYSISGTYYTEALESGDPDKILEAGDWMLDYYNRIELTERVAGWYLNLYQKRMDLRIYENRGDYEKAIDNAKSVAYWCEYLAARGKAHEDSLIAAKAHIEVLTPFAGVYAASFTQSDGWASNIAASSGTYYGSISSGYFAGRQGSQASLYVELGEETAGQFGSTISGILSSGRVCQINLNFKNKGVTAREIIAGKHDANIKSTVSYIGSLNKPVLVRIGGEMNIWSESEMKGGAVTPADFIAAYRRVADMFRSGAPMAELVWSPMQNGKWNETVGDYWPGDEYVDWVGMSLYYNIADNDGSEKVSWIEFSKSHGFTDPVRKAKTVCDFAAAHKKPVVITEGGSDKNGADGEAAAAALTAKMFSTLNMVYPQVKGIILFDRSINEAGKTRDFSMQTAGTYQTAILEAVRNNPALISSSEKAAAQWIPAENFSEKADDMILGATGYTYWDNELTVTYSFGGKTQKTAASPNLFTIKAADIKVGRNDLTVTFTGSKGFKLTKTYVVRRSASGVITVSSGVYPFTDLNLAKWCAPYVEAAYDTGLVKGVSATKYGTKNDLQIAQAVTLAARIYAEANGEEAPGSKGSPWYKPAYDYCVEKGIIDPALLPMSRLTEKCTRFEMVEILDKAIPASRWDGSVSIPDGYIPDLRLSDGHGDLVYRWYRAGIVGGDNTHRFNGEKLITRAEVAKILCTINRLM